MELNMLSCQQPGLSELVDTLVGSSSQLANKNRAQITNEISKGLKLTTNIEIVSSILGRLVQLLLTRSKESNIRISAKIFSNVVVMHIKDCNSASTCIAASGLQDLQPLVEKINGYVAITSYRNQQTTIAFSFPNF